MQRLISKTKDLIHRWVIKGIQWYQAVHGSMFPPVCRYTPTCSQYTIDAVNEYGVIKGFLLGLFRILRCNPLFEGGSDPVMKHHSNTKENSHP